MKAPIPRAALVALAMLLPLAAVAQDNVLNLYSARHYQTDEALYANFTQATGIRINRIEAGDEQLLERLKSEGANSPADVLLIVDASRLYAAQQAGLFRPVRSATLDARIPAAMRDPDGEWYGFSSRARVIVYNKARIAPADISSYESLADPRNKGKLCVRSGSHPYNLSLVAAMIEHDGEAKAEAWARGLVANFARHAQGRRQRPDQGGGGGRVRRRGSQHLLLRARPALDQARGPGDRGEDRRGVAQPGERRHARQHLGRRRAQARAARGRRGEVPRVPRRATPRSATSPTATTNGPRCRASW